VAAGRLGGVDIRERYYAMCDAGLYGYEIHERRYPLPVVDHMLVPFARERLAGLRQLIDGADSADLAGDAFLVAELNYHYLRLRRRLSADLLQGGAGAGWRMIPQHAGNFGVRALPGAPSREAVLVLRPAPGRHATETWEYSRLVGRPGSSGAAATTWTVTLPAQERTNIGVVHAPGDLESDEMLFAHLLAGLAEVTPRTVQRRE